MSIMLQSGVTKFHTRVVDEGLYLESKVDWPNPITKRKIRRKWLMDRSESESVPTSLDAEPYYPKCLGFESALKQD